MKIGYIGVYTRNNKEESWRTASLEGMLSTPAVGRGQEQLRKS